MIQLGKMQKLKVVKEVEFGIYLAQANASGQDEKILLPVKQIPAGTKIGDEIEVFVYKDSKDRLISTVRKPAIMLGEVKRLKVLEVGKIGAFLDWGLEKDLLLPFREQTKSVEALEECLVALYIDKSDRLCATMNVYKYLSTESPYQKEDRVTGTVYEISREFGAFVAVDDQFSGLIPQKELYGSIEIGSTVEARVLAVKEDGKLDLGIREKAYLQIEKDAAKVMEVMSSTNGELPITDKADPELIREQMQMSKNEFKRAIGHLLKARKILIKDNSITMIEKNNNK